MSEREIEFLRIVAKGLSLVEIAKLLGISANTVKTHVKRIYHKLAVDSRTEAVLEAHCMGLLHSIGGIDREFGGCGAISTINSDS